MNNFKDFIPNFEKYEEDIKDDKQWHYIKLISKFAENKVPENDYIPEYYDSEYGSVPEYFEIDGIAIMKIGYMPDNFNKPIDDQIFKTPNFLIYQFDGTNSRCYNGYEELYGDTMAIAFNEEKSLYRFFVYETTQYYDIDKHEDYQKPEYKLKYCYELDTDTVQKIFNLYNELEKNNDKETLDNLLYRETTLNETIKNISSLTKIPVEDRTTLIKEMIKNTPKDVLEKIIYEDFEQEIKQNAVNIKLDIDKVK